MNFFKFGRRVPTSSPVRFRPNPRSCRLSMGVICKRFSEIFFFAESISKLVSVIPPGRIGDPAGCKHGCRNANFLFSRRIYSKVTRCHSSKGANVSIVNVRHGQCVANEHRWKCFYACFRWRLFGSLAS